MLALKAYLPVIALAIALGCVAGGYRWGTQATRNAVLAEHAREAMLVESVQTVVGEAIAKLKVRNVTIRQEVQREIVEKPVYRECVHDPRVMQLINAALTGRDPVGTGELPRVGAVDGPLVWRDDGQAGRSGQSVSGVPQSGAVGHEMRF